MKARFFKSGNTGKTIEMLLSGMMLLYFGWLVLLTSNTISFWLSGAYNFNYSINQVEFSSLISFTKLTYILLALSIVAILCLIIGFTTFENAILKVFRRSFIIIGFLLLLFRIHLIYDF